jgi:hypothetical protein
MDPTSYPEGYRCPSKACASIAKANVTDGKRLKNIHYGKTMPYAAAAAPALSLFATARIIKLNLMALRKLPIDRIWNKPVK